MCQGIEMLTTQAITMAILRCLFHHDKENDNTIPVSFTDRTPVRFVVYIQIVLFGRIQK